MSVNSIANILNDTKCDIDMNKNPRELLLELFRDDSIMEFINTVNDELESYIEQPLYYKEMMKFVHKSCIKYRIVLYPEESDDDFIKYKVVYYAASCLQILSPSSTQALLSDPNQLDSFFNVMVSQNITQQQLSYLVNIMKTFINNAPSQIYFYLQKNGLALMSEVIQHVDHFPYITLIRCFLDVPLMNNQTWWIDNSAFLHLILDKLNDERLTTGISLILCSLIHRGTAYIKKQPCSSFYLLPSLYCDESIDTLLTMISITQHDSINEACCKILSRLCWSTIPEIEYGMGGNDSFIDDDYYMNNSMMASQNNIVPKDIRIRIIERIINNIQTIEHILQVTLEQVNQRPNVPCFKNNCSIKQCPKIIMAIAELIKNMILSSTKEQKRILINSTIFNLLYQCCLNFAFNSYLHYQVIILLNSLYNTKETVIGLITSTDLCQFLLKGLESKVAIHGVSMQLSYQLIAACKQFRYEVEETSEDWATLKLKVDSMIKENWAVEKVSHSTIIPCDSLSTSLHRSTNSSLYRSNPVSRNDYTAAEVSSEVILNTLSDSSEEQANEVNPLDMTDLISNDAEIPIVTINMDDIPVWNDNSSDLCTSLSLNKEESQQSLSDDLDNSQIPIIDKHDSQNSLLSDIDMMNLPIIDNYIQTAVSNKEIGPDSSSSLDELQIPIIPSDSCGLHSSQSSQSSQSSHSGCNLHSSHSSQSGCNLHSSQSECNLHSSQSSHKLHNSHSECNLHSSHSECSLDELQIPVITNNACDSHKLHSSQSECSLYQSHSSYGSYSACNLHSSVSSNGDEMKLPCFDSCLHNSSSTNRNALQPSLSSDLDCLQIPISDANTQ